MKNTDVVPAKGLPVCELVFGMYLSRVFAIYILYHIPQERDESPLCISNGFSCMEIGGYGCSATCHHSNGGQTVAKVVDEWLSNSAE